MTRETKDGFVVHDKRFWVDDEERDASSAPEPEPAGATPPHPPLPLPAPPAVDAEALRSALADLEETKYRVRRDAEKQLEVQRGRILEALLPVLDNLDRSIEAGAKTGNVEALLEGVKLVQGQFLAALGGFGLERRSALGARFDPHLHDAVALVPVTDPAQDGVVIHELEPAYAVGERVIRAARVVVGKSAERPAA